MRAEPDIDLLDSDLLDSDLPRAHADELFNVAAPPAKFDAGFAALLALLEDHDVVGVAGPDRRPIDADEPLSHAWWDASRWPRRERGRAS